MTFLPIVERELRVAGRQRGTYWTRLVVALVAVIIGAGIFFTRPAVDPVELGKSIFLGLGGVSLAYGLIAGRLFTADCLSFEKREGTLGLLFLTDLRGHDVVLGKLAATSMKGFYGLLAVFPVLAVPLLMGGITNGEFWRMVLVLTNTCLFSLAIGLFVSALCRESRTAFAVNFFLLLFLVLAGPAAGGSLMLLSNSGLPYPLFFGSSRTRVGEFEPKTCV